jgi:hypothetical protein
MPANPLIPRKRRKKRRPPRPRAPLLDLVEIWKWIKEYHHSKYTYPKRDTGPIDGTLGETWYKVDKALRDGTRGLQGGSSLARLLEAEFGVRNRSNLPDLDYPTILQWLDAQHAAIGVWARKDSGPVMGQPGETWANVDAALRCGLRGLPGGSSLARLLAEYRGVVNPADRPPLTEDLIAGRVVEHHHAKGTYPTRASGPIAGSDGDTWLAIDAALHRGTRGLPGGSSLADLLSRRFGVPNAANPPPLTEELILSWADLEKARSGLYPNATSGPVVDAPGETWGAINKALREGHRGLPGGSSLAELLTRRRGVRNNWHLSELSEDLIWKWMKAKHAREGIWPTSGSGVVQEAPEETWAGLDAVLRKGRRGLPGGSSLARLRAARLAAEKNKRK